MMELLIALTVMSIGILATYAMFQSGIMSLRRASTVGTASTLAESEMEGFRAIKFNEIGLDDAEVTAADSTYKAYGSYATDGPSTTLAAAATSTATTITVQSGFSGFPSSPPFRVKIGTEILVVTGLSGTGNTSWTVTRAQDSTTAASYSSGATVTQKKLVNLAQCGSSPCTTTHPTKTVTGADGRSYRIDTYVTWQTVANASGVNGRQSKRVTLVVRNPTTKAVYARVSSTFDLATGS
jgi:Tfp pilus assembly protein PilV